MDVCAYAADHVSDFAFDAVAAAAVGGSSLVAGGVVVWEGGGEEGKGEDGE